MLNKSQVTKIPLFMMLQIATTSDQLSISIHWLDHGSTFFFHIFYMNSFWFGSNNLTGCVNGPV